MRDYIEEIDNNFSIFFDEIETKLFKVIKELNTNRDDFSASYRRLVSMQAWRTELLENGNIATGAEFFREAQNDALVSHALARQGAWRVSLMALRSCIENTLFCLFYNDHPVELDLWRAGEHRLGFSETINYLSNHPKFRDLPETFTGISGLKSEYSTLSKAVHASSKLFRVTKKGEIEGLNIATKQDLGGWKTREKSCLVNINLILLTFFREDLHGAANINLRKAVSLVIGSSKHEEIYKKLGIKLKKTPNP